MSPTPEQLLELIYASKLVAKTIDEVDEKVASAINKIEDQRAALNLLREAVTAIEQKLEVLPLVLAEKLETLIDRRTTEAFDEIRKLLDELRQKLWGIKRQIKDATGPHQLITKEQLVAEKDERGEDGLSIKKGGFRLDLPMGEGMLKVLKIAGIGLLSLMGVGAATGGVWVLVEKLKHLLMSGG